MATLAGVIDVVTYIVIVIALSGHRLHAVMAARLHLFDRALGSLLMLIGISLLITQLVAG
jgi:threonine/homoserine/homoserine lactone efflux protein